MLKLFIKRALGPRATQALIAAYHAHKRMIARIGANHLIPFEIPTGVEIKKVKLAPVPIAEIADALHELGVKRGDWICVHASLSEFFGDGIFDSGAVEGKVRPSEYGKLILEMLFDLVGPDGLVMMPTDFAGNYINASNSGKKLSINQGKSNRGTLTEIFRKLPGVYRSTNPIYTVSIRGSGLEYESANHWDVPYAMDIGSPWDTFARRGGKVIFFGCGYDVNSFIHHPEYLLKNNYPLPVFYSEPHLFNVENADGVTRQIESFVHAVTWKYGTVSKFCAHLQEKYSLYNELEVRGRKIIVFDAQRQTDALFKELAQGITWYSAESQLD